MLRTISLSRTAAALLASALLAQPALPGQRVLAREDPATEFPVALFSAHPPEGEAPLAVKFTDASLGEVTSWLWDLGDGTVSRQREPQHVYADAGVYAVSLTVRGPGGTSRQERPRAVVVRSCSMGSARDNRGYPLERGEDFVPVTGDDSLGFYCVYSGKAVSEDNPGIANNVGIFVLPLDGGEVLIFGTGYGDENWMVEPTADAAHDALRVDAILRFCLGRTPELTPLRFAAPHGHIDHVNADFVREMRDRRYPVREIAYHSADANAVRNLPGWTTQDRATFRALSGRSGDCQEELASWSSPLGRIWLYLRAGHTAGSIDLAIDVRGDPGNRFVVRGSGEAYGTCPVPNVREAVDAHGNVLLRAPAPKLFALEPAHGSALGGTPVVLSGEDFTSKNSGPPLVLFDGVPATSVVVLDPSTITCVAPAGRPKTRVEVVVANRSGEGSLGGFSYRPLPTLDSLSPASGGSGGGTTVTLRGAGFLALDAGENVVTFGGAAASAVRALDDSTLECRTPPGASGLADVRVANANGSAELALAFRYAQPVDLVRVTPVVGSARGGTPVALEGSGFAVFPAVPEVWFGAARAADVVRTSDARLVCRTPPGAGGATVEVRVVAENGADSIPSGFRYFLEPSVLAVAPDSGADVGGMLVTLTGSHFTRNAAGPNAVAFGGVPALDVVALSDTQLRCRAPAGPAGARVDVTVTNANGTGRLAGGWRWHRRPALVAVEPNQGGREGGAHVTLRGAGFAEVGAGATLVAFGGAPATEVVVLDDATLTCRLPAAAADGAVAVEVANANGSALLADGFRYVTRPTLAGVEPALGPSSGNTLVTLRGGRFLAAGAGAPTVTFAGAPARDVVVLDDATLTCRTPSRPPGTRADVVLTSPNGTAELPAAFRYLELPTLTAVRPGEGPLAGGTRVSLSGAGFSYGAPTVRFGDRLASAVSVLSDAQIECTTPPGAAGAVNVSVRALGGTATMTDGFVYGGARVTLARVTPEHGSAAGGETLVIEGEGFVAGTPGATTVTIGGVAAASVVVQNDTRLTCLAPGGAPGSLADVRVANGNGGATLPAGYRHHLLPALAALAPAEGSALGGLAVTLSGSGFLQDLSAEELAAQGVRFGGAPATDVVALDDATLSCRVPPGAPGATVDVELANANGVARLAQAFRYRAGPTLDSVAPASGSPLGGTPVTLSGRGFALEGAGATSVHFGASAAASVVVVDDSTLTCVAPPGAPGGNVEVRLANANGESALAAAFRYHAAPAIASLAPANGPAAGGTAVILAGSGFKTNVVGPNTVTFGGRPARSVTTLDDLRVRAVSPAGPPGERADVVLSNSNGASTLAQGFRWRAAPALESLEPAAASSLGGTLVTLRGSGFLLDAAGVNRVLFGALPAASVVVIDDRTLTCVEPGGPPGGEVPVTIANDNGAAVEALAFRYFATPRVDELDPPHGFSGGGATVEVRGAGFLADGAGSNAVFFAAEEASDVVVLDDSLLRCRAPAGAPGAVAVRVENANGQGARADGFFYDWAPTLAGIAPAQGSSLGGQTVVLSGGGFDTAGAGAPSVRFGATSASDVRVLDGRTLECVAPAGPAGTLVAVTVSNSRGSSSLSGFRYHPRPTLASLSPPTGPPEGGTTVTLRGSGFAASSAGAASVTFDGVPATSVAVLDDATLTCETPPGPARESATVVVSNANGSASFADAFRWRARDPADLDDDGLADAALGAADGVYVFLGAAAGPLDESTASADLVLRHSSSAADFGAQVTSGDLDGDRVADLVIAAPLDDGGGTDTGAVYVFRGPLAASPTPRMAGSASAVFRGSFASDRFGTSVAVRDVTGDGVADLLVGAPNSDAGNNDAGAVYVYRGRTGFAGQGTSQAAVRLVGAGSQDAFGSALAAADVTGDGVADVVVGAPLRSGANEGSVYVFRGGAGLVSGGASTSFVEITGASNGDRLGTCVAAGDVDGDGAAELVLGAPDASSGGVAGGALFVLRGGATLSSRRADASSSVLGGENGGDRLGQAVALGDANGDGRADVLVGAPLHDVPAANAGRAYLVLGASSLFTDGGIEERAASLFVAESSSADQFGAALALADLDGDGSDEVLVGAPWNNGGGSNSGRVYVFLGGALAATRNAVADDATLTGAAADVALGREVASAR